MNVSIYLKLIRVKHWIKNSFVFSPLIFAGLLSDMTAWIATLIAFCYFCFVASATYVLNDCLDLEKDKRHPVKSKKRPLAAGLIKVSHAKAILIVLYLLALSSFAYSFDLGLVILTYAILNIAYSYALKHQPVLDIFCIAAGFLLRVYAGAVVLGVSVSVWMFITVLSLALFLASLKRRQEIIVNNDTSRKVLSEYSVELMTRFAEISATSSLVFYSLYVLNNHEELALTIPFVIFGLFRYWYLIEDGQGESPTDVLYTDKQLIFTVIFWLACSILLLFQA